MYFTCSCGLTSVEAMSLKPTKFRLIRRPSPVMLYNRNIKTCVYVPVGVVFTLTLQLAQRTRVGVFKRITNTSIQLFTNNILPYLSLLIRIKRSLNLARLLPAPSSNTGVSPALGLSCGTNPRKSFHTPFPVLLASPACHTPPLNIRISFLSQGAHSPKRLLGPRHSVGMSPCIGTMTLRK